MYQPGQGPEECLSTSRWTLATHIVLAYERKWLSNYCDTVTALPGHPWCCTNAPAANLLLLLLQPRHPLSVLLLMQQLQCPQPVIFGLNLCLSDAGLLLLRVL